MDHYQKCLNDSPVVKIGPALGVMFYIDPYRENF